MKIAIFHDAYLDVIGGVHTAVESQKAELEKRGHIVYLFSTGFPRQKAELARLAKKHIFMVPSCKLFFRGLAPVSRRPAIVRKWLLKTHPELKEFDLFYIHYEGGCSIAGIKLARELGIPSVQVMHGREDVGETNILPLGLRTFVAIMLSWFQSWYLPCKTKVKVDNYLADSLAKAKMWSIMVNHANNADLVLTPSQHFCDKLKHYGVTRPLKVLPNSFADQYYLPEVPVTTLRPGEPLRIIWHSRVSAEKRMMPFLKALTEVKSAYHVDVYGGGGDYYRARRFARRHYLKVTFHGNASFAKIYAKLQKSHLDVLVSHNFDTFGMTLIEAESVGVPSLICDPDLRGILPADSFILTTTPAPSDIARALNAIYQEPTCIAKMSQKLLRHRPEILASRRTDLLEKYFRELVK